MPTDEENDSITKPKRSRPVGRKKAVDGVERKRTNVGRRRVRTDDENGSAARRKRPRPVRRSTTEDGEVRKRTNGGRRRPTRRRKKRNENELVVIEELPSIRFIIGGEQSKWFIPACIVSILLISLYGGMVSWNLQYADPDPSFDGTSREYHDCIAVNFKYGSRNSSDHDPYHPENVRCAEKQGIDPNWSELEYQEWITSLLSDLAVDDGNHSGYVWTETGIATMTYLVSTMNANMSVYYNPGAGDEFNATHLALWNSATIAFGGGNDSYEDLLPNGGTAMAMYIGPGGIVGHKPTGFIWTAVGLATMEYLFALNNANMSLYGYPSEGDVFTDAHLGIWNAATVGFGGGNDSFESLLPGGDSAMAMYIGAGGIVAVAPTGYVWTEEGLFTMEYLFALNNANMSLYGYPSEGDVFTEEHLGIWNAATVGFGGGNDSMEDLVPGGGSALALYIGAGGIVLWSNLTEMPTVANVSISPSAPAASDQLTCTYDYHDPQGDVDASTVRWYLNGARTLDDAVPSELSTGDEVSCSVLSSDGTNPGFRIHSEPVIIA